MPTSLALLMYCIDFICMAFMFQAQQELHAPLMTSFDLTMRPHHTQTTSKYSMHQDPFIAVWNGKSHFSRHTSRTLVLLTGNQAGLHWSLHLAASNPQITANFVMKNGGTLPRTSFIHDTFWFSLSFSLYVSLNHNSWHSLHFWLVLIQIALMNAVAARNCLSFMHFV